MHDPRPDAHPSDALVELARERLESGRCRAQPLRACPGQPEGEACGVCDRCDGGLGDARRATPAREAAAAVASP